MSKTRNLLLIIFPILILAQYSCEDGPTRPDYRNIIVYAWDTITGGGRDIYVTDIEGTAKVSLTHTMDRNFQPTISPDGLKIAFVSNRDGNWHKLFIMNIDGSNQHTITFEDRDDIHPSWSPDGSKIVCTSYLYGIRIMNSDGTNFVEITDNNFDQWPSFSPDGSKILFVSITDDSLYRAEIFNMNVDGSNRQRITYNDIDEIRPSYSPDGTKILFHTRLGPNESDQIIILEGDSLTNISNSETGDIYPSWSPDGTQIVFTRLDMFNSGLYIMDNDGNNVYKIPNTDGREQLPCWSPLR
jgi:TolB protein